MLFIGLLCLYTLLLSIVFKATAQDCIQLNCYYPKLHYSLAAYVCLIETINITQNKDYYTTGCVNVFDDLSYETGVDLDCRINFVYQFSFAQMVANVKLNPINNINNPLLSNVYNDKMQIYVHIVLVIYVSSNIHFSFFLQTPVNPSTTIQNYMDKINTNKFRKELKYKVKGMVMLLESFKIF